jgi:predicted dehydrogenase
MIDVAVIGLGRWGRRIVDCLHGVPDRIRVTRAVDTDLDAAAPFCARHGIALSRDIDDALSDPAIDAVILCTPHSAHEAQILRAAAAAKHVFCEKPLGLNRASAERSVAACRAAGVVLGIGHERRFEKPMEEIQRLVDDGALGTIMHVEANFSHDRFVAIPPDNWRADAAEAPAAGMTGMGVHLTDSFIAMIGPVAEIQAFTARRVLEMPAGDVVSVLFRFECGATGFLCAISATPYYGRFTLFGAQGWAEQCDEAHPEEGRATRLTVCTTGERRRDIEFGPFDPVRAGFEAFADAVTGRAPYRFTDEQKIHNVAILEAITVSARSGQPVRLS